MYAGPNQGTLRSSAGLISPDRKGHQERAAVLGCRVLTWTGSGKASLWWRRMGDKRKYWSSVKNGLHVSGIYPFRQVTWDCSTHVLNVGQWQPIPSHVRPMCTGLRIRFCLVYEVWINIVTGSGRCLDCHTGTFSCIIRQHAQLIMSCTSCQFMLPT